ncbi:MAG: hypothetical protein II787_04845, partial [Lachnospiraceae bacterium]|nr:hypothetical protein [Lachnospiraceae bacterium]
EWEYIASKDIQSSENGETITYLDSEGSPITEEEYILTVEERFAGMEKSELKPDWINALQPDTEIDTESDL